MSLEPNKQTPLQLVSTHFTEEKGIFLKEVDSTPKSNLDDIDKHLSGQDLRALPYPLQQSYFTESEAKSLPVLTKHLVSSNQSTDNSENKDSVFSKKYFKLDASKRNSFKIRIKPRHKVSYTQSITEDDKEYLNEIVQNIKSVFRRPDYDDGSLAPIILRLAWHCCGTYDAKTNSGGSNGATMRFLPEITDEANYGLEIARAALEPIKQQFPRITYSDLWTLAGKLAIEEMGGPKIEWKCGRVDCKDSRITPPNGRLPFAYLDANHVRATFTRMGFNAQETVALLGCHGLGRCHKRISGWEGKWTSQPLKFSNEFFRVILTETWTPGVVPETGRSQYYNGDKTLMMLNTDMELINDPDFRNWVERYLQDEDLYFTHFALVFGKLLELGVPRN